MRFSKLGVPAWISRQALAFVDWHDSCRSEHSSATLAAAGWPRAERGAPIWRVFAKIVCAGS